MGKRPKLSSGFSTKKKTPKAAGNAPPPQKFSFSFRYFKQVKSFGLNKQENKWFVALLCMLRELSKETVDDFLKDSCKRNKYRYHTVDWNRKNIPIKLKELEWVDSLYLENPDEYPMVQFQVSATLGRVVGFFDEVNVFNIVLLDPLHNICPTKSRGYKVDSCSPLSCDDITLLNNLKSLISNNKCEHSCSLLEDFNNLPFDLYSKLGVFVLSLKEDNFDKIQNIISNGKCSSVEELLEYGVMFFEENNED